MSLNRTLVGLAVLGALFLAATSAAGGTTVWLRDFDDCTFQGLTKFDFIAWQTGGLVQSFFPVVVPPCPDPSDHALRLSFTCSQDRAVGLFADFSSTYSITTGGISMKMLIKYAGNPYTFVPGRTAFYVAVAMNIDPDFANDPTTNHFKGYWIYLGDQGANPGGGVPNDRGEIAIQYLCPLPKGAAYVPVGTGDVGSFFIDPFDKTKDWWVRGEVVDDGSGGALVRGRAWPDGAAEPDTWDVHCIVPPGAVDPSTGLNYLFTSGLVGFGGEQRNYNPTQPNYTSYIDVDDVSASLPLESYCPTNCSDPACDLWPSCQCNPVWADASGPGGVGKLLGDGVVDMDDFAVFQICYSGTGPIPAEPAYCKCFDKDGNNSIDSSDFDAFKACADTSGPGITILACP